MFALNTRHLFNLGSKVFVREIRQRRLPGPNPGLDQRLNAFREDGIKIEDDDAEEFIEQSDSSFYDVSLVNIHFVRLKLLHIILFSFFLIGWRSIQRSFK